MQQAGQVFTRLTGASPQYIGARKPIGGAEKINLGGAYLLNTNAVRNHMHALRVNPGLIAVIGGGLGGHNHCLGLFNGAL